MISADGANPAESLGALTAAFQRAAVTLRALAADDDRLALLRATIALQSALTGGAEMFAELPAFLRVAEPGPEADAELRARSAALAAERARVTEARERLAEQIADERTLLDLGTEHAELTQRIAAMERARALAKELPALWEQHRLLAEQVEGFGEPVLRAEQAVELAARELDRLTNLRIDGLRAEVTEALRAATASQARVTEQVGRRQEEITSLERTTAALATELAGLDERAGQLTAEHKDLQERLSLRLAANQRVATSLTGLREVELQLAGAEATLGAALRDRQEALRVNRERRFPGDGI